MSQEHIKDTRQRPPPSAVMASQQSPFVGPTPNMLPSNLPATFERNAASDQTFLSPILPQNRNLFPETLAHWPNFPHLKYPFENSYSDLTAHRQQHPLPFSMSRNERNLNTGKGKTNTNPPATPAQGHSLASPSGQRHDSLTKRDTVHVSPTSVPPGWRGSRIPSNNVPRKAPLAARSPDDISPFLARKIPKEKQQRSVSQPKATPEPLRVNRVRQQQSFNTPPSGTPKRGRPRLDEAHQDVKAAGDLGGKNGYQNSQNVVAQPPIGLFAPPQVSSTTPPKPHRPRPKYSYEVPLELEGTRKALGPDNWDRYVYLMEQLWTEEITPHEFDRRAKPIFQVFDDAIRKRLNNIMAMKMIQPRLEELRERGQSTKGTEDV